MSALTLIGERLNLNRESFRATVIARDAAAVMLEARGQLDAGATHLDFNAAHENSTSECADLLWLLETVLPELTPATGVVLDTVNRDCLKAALKLLDTRPGTILNSSSARPGEGDAAVKLCAELAAEHHAGAIVLLGQSPGGPEIAFDRVARAGELHRVLLVAGVPSERQYFDPQVLPVAYDPQLPRAILDAVREIRQRLPQAHLAAGVSNVSFNLPARGLLNRTYMAMLLASGIDTLICDPCGKDIRHTLAASRALLGQDDFLAEYLAVLGS